MATRRQYATGILYVDLDGTIRLGADERGGKFVNGPEDVEIFPGVKEALRAYKENGWRIVAVSNQGGIALGIVTMEKVTEAMRRTHELCGQVFDKINWCRHHPDARIPEMARCWCRKPRPGMAIESALHLAAQHAEYYPPHLSLFVGDRPEDRGCAEALNVDFVEAAVWRANWRDYLNGPIPARAAKPEGSDKP